MTASTLVPFGQWLLLRKISQSAILDLWQGEVREKATACLVRRLLPPYSMGAEYVTQFQERVRLLMTHSLPGSLPIERQDLLDEVPYSILSLPTGWNVAKLLAWLQDAETPVPILLAVLIARQVLDALEAGLLLPTGLSHGALLPESLWILPDGSVHLGDWDIGALAEIHLQSLESGAGRALRFTAPERLEHWGTATPAADAYSAAAILLEVLITVRLGGIPRLLPPLEQLPLLQAQGVPGPLLDTLERALSASPEARPDLHGLLDALLQVQDSLEASDPGFEPAAWLQKHAPPIAQFDPLSRVETDEDNELKARAERAARRARLAAREAEKSRPPPPPSDLIGKRLRQA